MIRICGVHAAGLFEPPRVTTPIAAAGFAIPLRHGRIAGINDPTTVVDFSGWPIVVHKKFPAELAYHIAGVLDKIREEIPYDAAEIPTMKQLCSNTEAGPLDFPLHPGAEKYYREKKYL